MDGDTLEGQAAACAIDLRTGLALVAEVAKGVQWVHEQGLIHRNITAANVLVDRNGDPRLIGFGRVRLMGAQPILIDGAGTPADTDVQGLRDLLRSICAALGHPIPTRLEHAIVPGVAMTSEGFAAAVTRYLHGEQL